MNKKQITDTILMIRPANFGFNEETAANNAFQSNEGTMTRKEIKEEAQKEFDQFVELLRAEGVNVIVIDDTESPVKSDAVFPNNWISFHQDGTVITYPMMAESRRLERREDIIDKLSESFEVKKRYSFEVYETQQQFLEGTGSMILDRQNNVLYACLSPRTDIRLLDKFCVLMGCEKEYFTAVDENGTEIYHTNVMMAVGKSFAVICLESIADDQERKAVTDRLERTNKTIIDISLAQVNSFAGNMLNVYNSNGDSLIIMSDQAYRSLSDDQINLIKNHGKIVHSPIPIIEKYGGGSVRCMMAEVFLPLKMDKQKKELV